MNYIYRIFWFFAGSDKDILAECPTSEKNKHFGIGATILITAIAAIISGTYAVQTLSDSPATSILMGIFWGFVIFNIDRLMVATLKKDPNNAKWKEAIKASPRLLLAIAIAVVISKPVEVKILENQIYKSFRFQKAEEIDELTNRNKKALGIDNISNSIDKANKELDKLTKEEQEIFNSPIIQKAEKDLNNCNLEYESIRNKISSINSSIAAIRTDRNYMKAVNVFVANGVEYREPYPSGLSGEEKTVYVLSARGNSAIRSQQRQARELRNRYPNCNSYQKIKDDYVAKRQKELDGKKDSWNKRKDYENEKYISVNTKIDTIKIENEDAIDKAGSDIFGKLITLEKAKYVMSSQRDTLDTGDVVATMETESTMMANISWAIMFFFFLLELCPILVKILADRGPYDDMLETQEIVIREKQRLRQQEVINETDTEIEMMREKSDTIRNTELGANQELIDQVSQARMDIARQVVAKWKDKQIQDLESNPEEFIDNVVQ